MLCTERRARVPVHKQLLFMISTNGARAESERKGKGPVRIRTTGYQVTDEDELILAGGERDIREQTLDLGGAAVHVANDDRDRHGWHD